MGYTGNPVGPMWFRLIVPGLVSAFVTVIFWVPLAMRPGQTLTPSFTLGLLALGIVATVFIGAGLLVGGRIRFRWHGWQADEARREEAAQQLADKVLAPLWKRVPEVRRPKTGPK